jgi:hypothetical protein
VKTVRHYPRPRTLVEFAVEEFSANIAAEKAGASACVCTRRFSGRFGEITRTPRLAACTALVATLGALGATAPTACADPTDDAFVAALQAKNIHYMSPLSAIHAGHQVCTELARGRNPHQVATDVMDNSALDGYHAGYFVGASMRAYCPGYIS